MGHSWSLNTAEFDYRWDIVRSGDFQRIAEQRETVLLWLARYIVADGEHAGLGNSDAYSSSSSIDSGTITSCSGIILEEKSFSINGVVDRFSNVWSTLKFNKFERKLIEGHKLALDALSVRVESIEQSQSSTETVMTLMADIVELRRDMDEMKSTDLSMFFCTVEIPTVLNIDILASSEIRHDDTYIESEVEKDEEKLGVRDEVV
ncbi:uncharacterized protein LOC125842799 [Solanum stenotomum]|uniref:uncharacterized protein LOC125842799 n=1 Tax=Solanum stenotomum TaxID=172797 RepID=UPI0020CFFB2E|nr:uncharacterized protein LOC125842799 [Solanum stenotomum]